MESFVETQRPYNANVAFSLMAEITEAVLPEHEASDPAFRLLLSACRAIQRVGLVALPVTYFALWTLRLGGWLPPLDRCSGCGRSLSGSLAWASEDGSGVHCQKCRAAAGRPISAEALAVVQPMLRESLDALVAAGGTRVPADLTNYLMDLIERHIERKLNVRPMLELVP
jgi:DNA repair protein RecO (recombination protein O)